MTHDWLYALAPQPGNRFASKKMVVSTVYLKKQTPVVCALRLPEFPACQKAKLLCQVLTSPEISRQKILIMITLLQGGLSIKRIMSGDVFGGVTYGLMAIYGLNASSPGGNKNILKSYTMFSTMYGAIASIDILTRIASFYPAPFLHPLYLTPSTNLHHLMALSIPLLHFSGSYFGWAYFNELKAKALENPVYLLQNNMLRWIPVYGHPGIFTPARMMCNSPGVIEWEPISVDPQLALKVFCKPSMVPSMPGIWEQPGRAPVKPRVSPLRSITDEKAPPSAQTPSAQELPDQSDPKGSSALLAPNLGGPSDVPSDPPPTIPAGMFLSGSGMVVTSNGILIHPTVVPQY